MTHAERPALIAIEKSFTGEENESHSVVVKLVIGNLEVISKMENSDNIDTLIKHRLTRPNNYRAVFR